jgi:hypothetical protein
MDEKDRPPDDSAITGSGAAEATPEPAAKTRIKISDRPHPITITLGLLSPALALVSLAVSFYVFRDSQRSMRVAQRAYLGFHFESGEVGPTPSIRASDPPKYRVRANVSVRDIGNTPAYIDTIKKELYAINADDTSQHIGGSQATSPDFDALVPRGDALLLAYDSEFSDSNWKGIEALCIVSKCVGMTLSARASRPNSAKSCGQTLCGPVEAWSNWSPGRASKA